MSEVVGILCQRFGFQARSSQTLFALLICFPFAATATVANFNPEQCEFGKVFAAKILI